MLSHDYTSATLRLPDSDKCSRDEAHYSVLGTLRTVIAKPSSLLVVPERVPPEKGRGRMRDRDPDGRERETTGQNTVLVP